MWLLIQPFRLSIPLSRDSAVGPRLIQGLRRRGATISAEPNEYVIDIVATQVLSLPTFGRLRFVVRNVDHGQADCNVQFISLRLCYYLLTIPLGLVCVVAIVIGSQRWGAVVALFWLILGGHALYGVTVLKRSDEVRAFVNEICGGLDGPDKAGEPKPSRLVNALNPMVYSRPRHLSQVSRAPRFYRYLFVAVMTRIAGDTPGVRQRKVVIAATVLILSCLLAINTLTIRFATEKLFELRPTITAPFSMFVLAFLGSIALHVFLLVRGGAVDRAIDEFGEDLRRSRRATTVVWMYVLTSLILFVLAAAVA